MKPSFTLIFGGLFFAFILHSIWNLLLIFQAPVCQKGDVCYTSYLNLGPDLDLLVFTTDKRRNNEQQILAVSNFNYEESFERYVCIIQVQCHMSLLLFKYNLNIVCFRELMIDLPESVRNNGTMLIHTIVLPSRNNNKELTISKAVRVADAYHLKDTLTQYMVPKSSTFNLLKEETKKQYVKPVIHLRTKYSVMICTDNLNIPHNNIPNEIINLLRINSKGQFLPMVIQDFFQTRLRDLEEVNQGTTNVKILYTYNPATIGKFKFLMQMQMTFQHFLSLGFTEKDVDEVKGVFADTNVYLLCATVFIGSIHVRATQPSSRIHEFYMIILSVVIGLLVF